ncbi:unnamed protein product [Polarella glacialis]|uniref:Uncharacterized protein n=1 Tax=Polarella glacialis TaxID=89957 RepID=A0A813K4U0_POLGL|nr:unnamed protein product [Polarella glacialis]
MTTPEHLHEDFRNAKNEADTAEHLALSSHLKTDQVMRQNLVARKAEHQATIKEKAEKQTKIADPKNRQATTEISLADDQAFIHETTQMCEDKAATDNQRKDARGEEPTAISSASRIMSESTGKNDPVAGELRVGSGRCQKPSHCLTVVVAVVVAVVVVVVAAAAVVVVVVVIVVVVVVVDAVVLVDAVAGCGCRARRRG